MPHKPCGCTVKFMIMWLMYSSVTIIDFLALLFAFIEYLLLICLHILSQNFIIGLLSTYLVNVL